MSVLHGVNDLAGVGRVPRPAGLLSCPLPGYEADEILLVVDPQHPLTALQEVHVEQIREYPLILRTRGSATRTAIDAYFAAQGFQPLNTMEADSLAFTRYLVLKRAGLGLMSRLSVDEFVRQGLLRAISFAAGGIWMKKDLVYRDESLLSGAARVFLEFMMDRGPDSE